MSIFELQNLPGNLSLLAAQKHLYTKAKQMQQFVLHFTIVLAISAPLVLIFLPSSKIIMAMLGVAWLLFSRIVLERHGKYLQKKAAIIQEEFDCNVFGLPWNRILVGDKITPELVNEANRDFSGNRELLKNWYVDTSSLLYPIDVLVCQRSNLVWDWRLRRYFVWIVSITTIIFLLCELIIGIIFRLSLLDYLLALLIPAMPAIVKAIEISDDHLRIADEKVRMEKEILSLWNSFIENHKAITREDCRNLQNNIFILRNKGQIVPDQWYSWHREKFQIDTNSVVVEYIEQATKVLGIKENEESAHVNNNSYSN